MRRQRNAWRYDDRHTDTGARQNISIVKHDKRFEWRIRADNFASYSQKTRISPIVIITQAITERRMAPKVSLPRSTGRLSENIKNCKTQRHHVDPGLRNTLAKTVRVNELNHRIVREITRGLRNKVFCEDMGYLGALCTVDWFV